MMAVRGEARRELAAVLFADVAGYTRHLARDEAGTVDRVGRALERALRLVGDYGGRVVDTAGDGVFAVFADARDAVRFAVAYQQDLAGEELWQPDEARLRFRVGIHLGEVQAGPGDKVSGLSVNIAARLQTLAGPGGVCVSDDVRRSLDGEPGLAWRQVGWRRLHNVDSPVLVHSVGPGPRGAAAVAAAETPCAEGMPDGGEASVAVLPLDPLSDEPMDQHLASGISADIIHNLTRFRDLLVIARESAFRFRDAAGGGSGADAHTVARCLGVRYLFRGSMQRSGRHLRIRCQLSECENGRSLWADRLDGALDDIFAMQDEITDAIASRLAHHVAAAERERLGRSATPELSAYGLVLRGEELSRQCRREPVLHARRLLKQAAEIDLGYGRACAALSRTYNYDWRYSWSARPERALDRALALAGEAVERDGRDARGYAELGFAHLYRKEHDAALAAYERALELNPNDADVTVEYADALVYVGEAERSVGLIERAMRLNPYYPDWYLWYLADAYSTLRQHEQVIATIGKMRNPAEGRRMLAAHYARLGLMDEAREQACEILRLHPGFRVSEWAKRPPYRDREPLEFFMEGLRLAGLPA